VSIFIALGLLVGISAYELYYVDRAFTLFQTRLEALYQKAESNTATYEDGVAVQTFWRSKKKTLHVWLPHTALQEIDYQLDEAVGFMYLDDYENALPKIEVLLGLSQTISHSYSLKIENIF
jgi:hypothetical protein